MENRWNSEFININGRKDRRLPAMTTKIEREMCILTLYSYYTVNVNEQNESRLNPSL